MVNVVTKTNAKIISQHYAKAAKEIKKAASESVRNAGEYMHLQALSMVPIYTGETMQGITLRVSKNEATITSEVSPKGKSGFMRNLWTNRTAPWRQPHMVWNGGEKTLYGNGTHRTTGTPRWFHLATLRSKEYFDKQVRDNTDKALKSSGFR